MKIALLNTLFPPHVVGGAEKSVSILAKSLVEAGHSVIVISLHPEPTEQCTEWHGVKVYYLPLDNLYWPFTSSAKPSLLKRILWHVIDTWNWRAAARVGRILDTEQPDVLHTNIVVGFSPSVWRVAHKRGIRIVHTLREYGLLCPRSTLFRSGKTCTERCSGCFVRSEPNRWASRWVSTVIGLSDYTLRVHLHERFFPAASTGVIFNAIDLKDAPQAPRRPGTLDGVRFGYLGRVTRDKGIEVLLEACAKLKDGGWRLLIAGSGRDAYLAELQARFELARVEWLGFTAPTDFFAEIDCLVVPSIWAEPFGRIVIEAAACGVPVIVSDAGGIPEIMELGLPGTIVPAGDADALAAALDRTIRNGGRFEAPVQQSHWRARLSAAAVRDEYVARYAAVVNAGGDR